MFKLNKSNTKLINYLLKDLTHDNILENPLTSSLDNFLNTYYFKEKSNVINIVPERIYLYNTHNSEKYKDNLSIYVATKELKNNLEKLGLKVILEENDSSELLSIGLNNYNISREYLLKNMNNSIAYYIDIHRDSVSNTSIVINNKKYAKLLFVLGLDNPNYKKNKEVLLKMNNYLNKKYPGLSKGILEKKGNGVDGVYNQDLGSNVILLEIGGIDNTKEEVYNSTEIVALMLYHIIGDISEQSTQN